MTNIEFKNDLVASIAWMLIRWENSEAKTNCEEAAKNLTKYAYHFEYSEEDCKLVLI